jgi:hypothetical protein
MCKSNHQNCTKSGTLNYFFLRATLQSLYVMADQTAHLSSPVLLTVDTLASRDTLISFNPVVYCLKRDYVILFEVLLGHYSKMGSVCYKIL